VTSEDGFSWTRSEGVSGNLFAVTAGNGQFVAVGGGFGAAGLIVTSTDALVWTPQVSGTLRSLVDVTYGNGLFLIVGLNVGAPPPATPEVLLTSGDGVQWSFRNLPLPQGLFTAAYGASTFVMAGGAGFIVQSGSYAPAELQVVTGSMRSGLELAITGEIGRNYRLQATTDLGSSNWMDLFSFNNAQDATTTFVDLQAGRFPRRYYRVVSP
jgi:hypothetical protein